MLSRFTLRCFKYAKSPIACIVVVCVFIWIASSRNSGYRKRNIQRCSNAFATNQSSLKSRDERQCSPLSMTEFIEDADATELTGDFMKELDQPRSLMTFLHEPNDFLLIPSECSHSKVKWKLAFFVKTSLGNFERRRAIRETWGAVSVHDWALIKVFFIVGTGSDAIANDKLGEEAKTYGDILQMDLVDTSKTVPEKVLAGMQWSAENLPMDWMYASIDDDMVVYHSNLISYLNGIFQKTESRKPPPCYEDLPVVCVYNFQKRDSPNRWWFSKWFVSKKEFSQPYWPPYCRGGLYLMSNQLNSDIFRASRTTSHLSMDDVWITGLMRRKLKFGDCNIMAAPYALKPDFFLFSWMYDDGGDKALMKHLWGNTNFYPVDPPVKLRSEWKEWKVRTGFRGNCVRATT